MFSDVQAELMFVLYRAAPEFANLLVVGLYVSAS